MADEPSEPAEKQAAEAVEKATRALVRLHNEEFEDALEVLEGMTPGEIAYVGTITESLVGFLKRTWWKKQGEEVGVDGV